MPRVVANADTLVFLAIIIFWVIAFGSWVSDSSDYYSRREIFWSTCQDISAKTNDALSWDIKQLIIGPTGNDDERAIIKVLECISCQNVSVIVSGFGLEDFLSEFQGAEWDRLMVRLKECGMVSFKDWDDDPTRRFINRSDCTTISSLSPDDLSQLVKNLLSGDTGDDDEQAIIKLFQCLSCDKRKEVMSRPGSKYADIDPDVQGEEWATLKPLLKCN